MNKLVGRIFAVLAVMAMPLIGQASYQRTTYAALPNCGNLTKGRVFAVTNCNSVTACTAGGGSFTVPMMCDGTNWVTEQTTAGGSGDERLPSLENPPESPGTYDDEFNSSTLDPDWSWAGTATTPALGDIDPLSNVVTTPVYNLDDQWPGHLGIQSDDATSETIILRKSYSPASNETFLYKLSPQIRVFSTAGEGSFHLLLTNSSDDNEQIYCGITHTSSGTMWEFGIQNNGSFTSRLGVVYGQGFPFSEFYFLLYKTGDVYSAWIMGSGGTNVPMGAPVTKTGVTTFDQIDLRLVTGNETPSTFVWVDFIRYYPTNTFEVMNP